MVDDMADIVLANHIEARRQHEGMKIASVANYLGSGGRANASREYEITNKSKVCTEHSG